MQSEAGMRAKLLEATYSMRGRGGATLLKVPKMPFGFLSQMPAPSAPKMFISIYHLVGRRNAFYAS